MDELSAALRNAGKTARQQFTADVVKAANIIPANPVVQISWQSVIDCVYDALLDAGINPDDLSQEQIASIFQDDLESLTSPKTWPVEIYVRALIKFRSLIEPEKPDIEDAHLEAEYEDRFYIEADGMD